jgi:hypothetical protein
METPIDIAKIMKIRATFPKTEVLGKPQSVILYLRTQLSKQAVKGAAVFVDLPPAKAGRPLVGCKF